MGESKAGRMTPQKDGPVREVSLPRTIHLVPLDYLDGFIQDYQERHLAGAE